MLKVLNCVIVDHDLRLVALSAIICALGCFTTVSLLARAQALRSRGGARWLVTAAAIFGCSVWSLHFVAMLAFTPGTNLAYSLDYTTASIFVAIGGAWIAFHIWQSRLPRMPRLLASGTCLGLAVVGMHYVGVAALAVSGLLFFDLGAVAASVVVSIAFSVVGLARATSLVAPARRLEVAGWLALAICGLHFTGMSALTVSPATAEIAGRVVLGSSTLAVVVGSVSLVLLAASLAAILMGQHLSDRALKELGRMRLLSNLAHEVLIIQRDGTVLEMNNAGERLFGTGAGELIGRPLLELFSESSVPALIRRSACPVEDRRPEEMDVLTVDGLNVAVELSCQPIDYLGKPATAVALRDLTERRRDEERIRFLARHDAVTNLPNRYNLHERLDLALDTAGRDGARLAVVYIDLDRFKPVNDLYGHAAGDALLLEVSRRMAAEMAPGETLARIGGDEFVMLLQNGSDPERVSSLASRLIEAVRRPFQIEGHKVEIGASVGIALYPGDGATADALLRAADTAMYRVKDEGRGSWRFFEACMDAQLQARRQLEQELSRAVENDELLLHFQPMVNGVTGEVETVEALVRWRHPTRGLVPPGEFIPLAEESGLITAIGNWVLDVACRAAMSWPQPWRVSVNVSPCQFVQSDVCEVIRSALERSGLPPSRLLVEITEGVLIDDPAKAVTILKRLRGLGIRLALDDFGTGFSSLSYLQLFKFDKFKIDKSFVNRLGQSEDALTITRTIVNLGHNLGLQVVAEGVETVQQLSLLQGLGCDQIQGFLVARPAPIDALTELERARARALFHAGPLRLSA